MDVRTRIKRVIKFSRAREENQQIICSAIKQMRPIEFYYRHGYRTVEPFALGIVLNEKQDNLSLLCWQTGGFSDLLEVVGWKLYRVSDMEDIDMLKERFTGDRPGYEPQNLEMARVICCADKVPQPEEAIVKPPQPELETETAPVITYEPPPPPPEPQPVIRYLTHNELMERFRFAHPQPIPELYDLLWPEPLAMPFPEPVPLMLDELSQEIIEPKYWHGMPVDRPLRYLMGQTA